MSARLAVACDEEIADTEGYAEPCGRRAVGYRIDPEENEPYPVCATHHRWPYADEWVSLAATVQRVRVLCEQWERWDGYHLSALYLRDALAPSDPATDTGGEGRAT